MPLKWKLIFILLVVIVSGVMCWPLNEKLKLGLDLKGGTHLLLGVDTDEALKVELDDNAARTLQALDKAKVTHGPVEPGDLKQGNYGFSIKGIDAEALDKAKSAAKSVLPEYDVRDVTQGLEATLTSTAVDRIRDTTVEQALTTIENRINQYGVTEPLIQRQGRKGERILVQLPGVDDPERVKKLIGKVAFLEIKLVNSGPFPSHEAAVGHYGAALPPQYEVVEEIAKGGTSQFYGVERLAIINGRDLTGATGGADQYGRPAVHFNLSTEGSRKFSTATAANVGHPLAIMLDGRISEHGVANIQERISDSGQITGSFTPEEARDLALVLRAGALPAKIKYLEERSVGPALGTDSIHKGISAGILGLVLVVLFMLVYYRGAGINAVVALSLNMLLLVAALAGLHATLTLPGIAGYILTIGMAVDANVLIFERIREDLRAGISVRQSIQEGFAKAFWTIFDSNLTTIIAALCLIQFGTGPIRGFAITLSVGLIASMFTAVWVSKVLFDASILRGGRAPSKLSI